MRVYAGTRERDNPAMASYLRLGFDKAGEHGLYDLMRWNS
jgi:hypothetical protein